MIVVSTHAPTRGATIGPAWLAAPQAFQPTRPRGARQGTTHGCCTDHCFNPRAHEGRDPVSPVSPFGPAMFQPTRPRGARHPQRPIAPRPSSSFNPRAHEGRDVGDGGDRDVVLLVSTHAPTRGATATSSLKRSDLTFQPTRPRGARHREEGWTFHCRVFQPTRPRGARRPWRHHRRPQGHVSTHAPTRGATRLVAIPGRPQGRFNPRAHEGRDHDGVLGDRRFRNVSTHAPTRGATTGALTTASAVLGFQPTRPRGARLDSFDRRGLINGSFNPRAHEGRDMHQAGLTIHQASFNPRAHEGRDRHRGSSAPARAGFNPRAHEGRDTLDLLHAPLPYWFQPTRPRGARRQLTAQFQALGYVSTHAPTRGATLHPACPIHQTEVFQPTRPRGARLGDVAMAALAHGGFNPRAHEGRDVDHAQHYAVHLGVSTHAPTRGATCSVAFQAGFQVGFNPRAHEGRDPDSSV